MLGLNITIISFPKHLADIVIDVGVSVVIFVLYVI